MDDISEKRLSEVHPLLAEKIRAMADELAGEGIPLRVTQGFRSWETQSALYAQGRTMPGEIVTKAEPGYSYHNFGLAVDVVPMTGIAGAPDWNVQNPVWTKIVEAGKRQGLEAGAEWRTFPDFPHFQLIGSLPVSPNDAVRAAFFNGGPQAVWELAGLSPGAPAPETPA